MSWTVLLSTLDSGPSPTYTHFSKGFEVQNMEVLKVVRVLDEKKLNSFNDRNSKLL